MAEASDEAMRSLAESESGAQFDVAGAFQTVVNARPGGGAFGIPKAAAVWAVRKLRTPLPPYPYLGMTLSELVVFEFRFAATLELKRTVGRWSLDSVEVLHVDPALCQVALRLRPGRRAVELKGAYGSDAERAVVRRLGEVQARQR